MIFVKTDNAIDTMKRLGVSLDAQHLIIAESRAINKSLGLARTQARKEIKDIFNISQKNLSGINFIPSRTSGQYALSGKLYAGRKPIPLDAFAPKQETNSGSIKITKRGAQKVTVFKRPKSNPTSGVSIEIYKGKRLQLPNAFMIKGGAIRVFMRGEYRQGTQFGFVERHQRVTNEGNDLPIKPLITISEFGMVLNDVVLQRIGNYVVQRYPKILENQITNLLDTVGNGR